MAKPHPGEKTVRIGEQLHLGLVSARLPPASGRVFQSDRLYSYDVTITGASQARTDLAGLGLLGAHTVSGVECGPLGYADRMLPCFALPPTELADLRLAYGSCRRPGYDDGDALAWMDEYLNERFDDPRGRIHQLFLGGDQIYADDVDSLMMLRTAQLGVELFGTDGGVPRERVKVNQVLRRPPTPQPDPADPNAAYTPETAQETAAAGDLPAGPPQFPIGDRLRLTTVSGQLTSVDGANHLISLGEFAAAYVLAWSPACWGDEVPGSRAPGARRGDRPGAALAGPAERRPGHRPAPRRGPRAHPAAPVRRQGDLGRACEEGGGEEREEAEEGGRGRPAVPPAQPSGAPGVPARARSGAARAGQRADVHDARRPRRHGRLLPQPDVASPGARDGPRAGDPDQRDAGVRALPGLGQQPGPVRPGHHPRAARAGRTAPG